MPEVGLMQIALHVAAHCFNSATVGFRAQQVMQLKAKKGTKIFSPYYSSEQCSIFTALKKGENCGGYHTIIA